MKIRVLPLVAIFVWFSSASAASEGVPVKPGKWEMTTTVEMPMMPAPQVTTTTECITKSEISPDEMRKGDSEQVCKTADLAIEGNTARWKMECHGTMNPMRGEGEVTSSGTTLRGKAHMTTRIEGQPVTVSMRWEGRRVGECD